MTQDSKQNNIDLSIIKNKCLIMMVSQNQKNDKKNKSKRINGNTGTFSVKSTSLPVPVGSQNL